MSEANIDLDSLSPAEKRVAIAQDVIKQIDGSKIIPKNNTWLHASEGQLITGEDVVNDRGLKEVLCEMVKPCQACQLGALIFSTVRLLNKVSVREALGIRNYDPKLNWHNNGTRSLSFSDMDSYLQKYFDTNQLEMMEFCFENGRGSNPESKFEDDIIEKLQKLNAPFLGEAYEADDYDEDDDYELDRIHLRPVEDPEGLMRAICQNIIDNKGEFVP